MQNILAIKKTKIKIPKVSIQPAKSCKFGAVQLPIENKGESKRSPRPFTLRKDMENARERFITKEMTKPQKTIEIL